MSTPLSVLKALDEIKRRELHGATLITRITLDALSEAAVSSKAKEPGELFKELKDCGDLLVKSRPTSILLVNGTRHVLHQIKQGVDRGLNVEELRSLARLHVTEFLHEIEDSVNKISEIGARRLSQDDVILTHGYSTSVISVLQRAQQEGKNIRVMVTETRPEFQGRLIAKELAKLGIPTTMIVDSAVCHFMKDINKVLVGAEAVAANGAVVNKIGTSAIASVAHESRVRVFVAASIYKFSPETMFGELIEIEERDPFLVISKEELQSLGNITVRNPAFDVTPPEHIDLIITERGVMPPQGAIMILRERRQLPILDLG
ncbi:MAG: Ribose 1,5-bisphosphate isomerase [Candidatus Bathyarchaeota archaeon BA1]|nr:MAG: Ribose 1,5-bisphosphate isomerase [Candidatus Bathyarchaeota archaeon BA1]